MAKLEDLLKETFQDIETLSPEKIQNFVQQLIPVLTELQQKGQSSDPEELEEAKTMALSLKELFQGQAEELCKNAGIDPDDLLSGASEEEEEELQETLKSLEQFQETPS